MRDREREGRHAHGSPSVKKVRAKRNAREERKQRSKDHACQQQPKSPEPEQLAGLHQRLVHIVADANAQDDRTRHERADVNDRSDVMKSRGHARNATRAARSTP